MSDIDRLTAAIDRLTAVIDKHLEIERMQAEAIGQLAKMLTDRTVQDSLRATEGRSIVAILEQTDKINGRLAILKEKIELTLAGLPNELQKQSEKAGDADQ